MMIMCFFGKTDTLEKNLKTLRSYGVDGILILGSEGELSPLSWDIIRDFRKDEKPVVLMGRGIEDQDVAQLDINNHAGISELVRMLVDRKHRRIGFIGGDASNPTIQARWKAFKETLAELNLSPDEHWVSFSESNELSCSERIQGLLDTDHSPPDALVCSNDLIAMEVIGVFTRHGLQIPHDIAITGVDDIAAASLTLPRLTTIRQPFSEMAQETGEILFGKKSPDTKKIFPLELIVRETA